MPLYEYQCDACGHRFELIQKFSDPPADACPKCGGSVHKVVSAPAFQLKGTGWYATDYAKKDSGGADTAAKDDKPAAADKNGKSAEAEKPAAEKATPAAPDTSSAGESKS